MEPGSLRNGLNKVIAALGGVLSASPNTIGQCVWLTFPRGETASRDMNRMDAKPDVDAHRSLADNGGIVTELATLPPEAHLDGEALGRMLGRCRKSIQRAVRRGELPPPFKFMGRHVWLVKTILDHMKARQNAALQLLERRVVRMERHRP